MILSSVPFFFLIDQLEELTRTVDLVVTLGGDGTILHTSSLFTTTAPPIVSFSMGTLGFLIPFSKSYSL
jgi:NADH kinase